MNAAWKAGAAYFLLVFAAGFLLGTVRVMLLAPALGETIAVLMELPVMLAISWFTCRLLVQRFSVPATASARLAMGVGAFIYLMLAEAILAITLFGESLAQFIADFSDLPAQLGLAGQIAFALMPLFERTLAKR